MIELKELGNRICIIGPSSTGKSTLAKILGEQLHLRVFYLDQLAHIPHSNWQRKSDDELKKAHQLILEQLSEWIIEGNYSFLMPERFANATTIIWLDYKICTTLWSYFKRTFDRSKSRQGNLKGPPNKLNYRHLYQMLFKAPKNRKVYIDLVTSSSAHSVHIKSFKELNAYYQYRGLKLNQED